jgi:opacity protein-like surface antigen
MRKLSHATATLSALLVTSLAANAADMHVKAQPRPAAAAPYNWSGLYIGGNFGGAWTSGNLNIPGNNLFGGITEFIGGVQAGYNFQAGHLWLAWKVISMGRLLVILRF